MVEHAILPEIHRAHGVLCEIVVFPRRVFG
ncbi:MAG: hypothetical protein RLZZ522_950, partial [Verrucomicrobiota bacterium]